MTGDRVVPSIRVLAVVQARSSSSRFPAKVLAPILGRPMLARQIERVQRATSVDRVVVATSAEASDDPVAAAATTAGASVYRGDLDDVLARVWSAAAEHQPEHLVRLTGDCPLTDPRVIDLVVGEHLRREVDYTSNTLRRTYPDGLDVEVLRMAALTEAAREARLPSEREHVTPFVYLRPERFTLHSVELDPDLSALRWVVDHPEDLEVVAAVYDRLHKENPGFGMREVLRLMEREPEIFAGNRSIDADEGWSRSLERDAEFRREQEQREDE